MKIEVAQQNLVFDARRGYRTDERTALVQEKVAREAFLRKRSSVREIESNWVQINESVMGASVRCNFIRKRRSKNRIGEHAISDASYNSNYERGLRAMHFDISLQGDGVTLSPTWRD